MNRPQNINATSGRASSRELKNRTHEREYSVQNVFLSFTDMKKEKPIAIKEKMIMKKRKEAKLLN